MEGSFVCGYGLVVQSILVFLLFVSFIALDFILIGLLHSMLFTFCGLLYAIAVFCCQKNTGAWKVCKILIVIFTIIAGNFHIRSDRYFSSIMNSLCNFFAINNNSCPSDCINGVQRKIRAIREPVSEARLDSHRGLGCSRRVDSCLCIRFPACMHQASTRERSQRTDVI